MSPPPFFDLLRQTVRNDPESLEKLAGTGPTVNGKYRHWDILRHLTPPDGLTHELWWLGLKSARLSSRNYVPLRDREGQSFAYTVPDVALRMLHEIDRDASGTISVSSQVTSPQTRDTYLVSSLMEEAIASSQLEGAATTREVAKEMIRRGRGARDTSEKMILNNYEALKFIRRIENEPLTPQIVLELQRILTEGTLDDLNGGGRFRTAAENIVVSDALTDTVLHNPPAASTLASRMELMCEFANEGNSDSFVHPVLRSILLHFWLAYDHPFVDGNGRTARALFYWSMARHGYWLTEFISISRVIKQAQAKYSRSFLYTETDDNDATYFILAQLRIVTRAIQDLHEYLARKTRELHDTAQLLRQSAALRDRLNHRQLALMTNALKRPETQYTFESHKQSHRVAYATARSDLMELAALGLLVESRVGRTYAYHAARDLHDRISAFSSRLP